VVAGEGFEPSKLWRRTYGTGYAARSPVRARLIAEPPPEWATRAAHPLQMRLASAARHPVRPVRDRSRPSARAPAVDLEGRNHLVTDVLDPSLESACGLVVERHHRREHNAPPITPRRIARARPTSDLRGCRTAESSPSSTGTCAKGTT